MSGIRVDGVWRVPALTSVKVDGAWRQVGQSFVKVDGVWRVSDLAGPPETPVLAYTGEGEFTITDFDPALVYVVSGATLTGALLTEVTDGATVRSIYAPGAPPSNPSTMRVLAHGRVLGSVAANPSSQGCGPRPTVCCPAGTVMDTAGTTCSNTGTQVPDNWCNNECPGWCFGMYLTCYHFSWTDYSANGFTLIGAVWGKAING